MKNKKTHVRKIAIWSDFFWCRLYEVQKEIASRKDSELEFASKYKIVVLPKGMLIPTQEFLEEVVEDYFT